MIEKFDLTEMLQEIKQDIDQENRSATNKRISQQDIKNLLKKRKKTKKNEHE